jgi:putative MATE family efflux protein
MESKRTLSKEVWHLAFPLILTNVLSAIFTLVDMYFVGKLSIEAVSAVGIGGIIDTIFIGFGMGGAVAGMAMVARYTGAMDKIKAERAAWNSIIFAIFLSLPVTFGGLICINPLLKFIGAEGEVFRLSSTYLKILIEGYIFQLLYFYSADILRGVGDVKRPTLALALGVGLNIVLDPLLIFGIGPFPKMGVAGAALATLLTRGVGAAILIFILAKGISGIKLRITQLSGRTLKELTTIGMPASGERMLIDMAHVVFMVLVVRYGAVPTAAYTIVTRLRQLILMPGFGLGMAASIMVGQSLGAEQPEKAEKASWLAVKHYEIFMIIISILFFIFAPYFIKFFNPDLELILIGTTCLRISVISHPLLALSIILFRSMCGAGYTKVPLTMRLTFTFLLRIGMGILLSNWIGLNGLWYAIMISQLLEGISSTTWFKLGRWKYRAMS